MTAAIDLDTWVKLQSVNVLLGELKPANADSPHGLP